MLVAALLLSSSALQAPVSHVRPSSMLRIDAPLTMKERQGAFWDTAEWKAKDASTGRVEQAQKVGVSYDYNGPARPNKDAKGRFWDRTDFVASQGMSTAAAKPVAAAEE